MKVLISLTYALAIALACNAVQTISTALHVINLNFDLISRSL